MRRTLICVALLLISQIPARAEIITFQCSWGDERPITLRVDTDAGKAARDDGGKTYTLVMATPYFVLLLVHEPRNVMGAAVQMIQRRAAVKPDNALAGASGSGKWVDVVMSSTGAVSSIDGGRCWER